MPAEEHEETSRIGGFQPRDRALPAEMVVDDREGVQQHGEQDPQRIVIRRGGRISNLRLRLQLASAVPLIDQDQAITGGEGLGDLHLPAGYSQGF